MMWLGAGCRYQETQRFIYPNPPHSQPFMTGWLWRWSTSSLDLVFWRNPSIKLDITFRNCLPCFIICQGMWGCQWLAVSFSLGLQLGFLQHLQLVLKSWFLIIKRVKCDNKWNSKFPFSISTFCGEQNYHFLNAVFTLWCDFNITWLPIVHYLFPQERPGRPTLRTLTFMCYGYRRPELAPVHLETTDLWFER